MISISNFLVPYHLKKKKHAYIHKNNAVILPQRSKLSYCSADNANSVALD